MPPSDVIETTVAEVTAELLRRGVGPDEAVSIIIEPVEGLALARRKSRVRVVAAGLTDTDIDRLIKQAQQRSRAEPGRGHPPALCAARRGRSRTAAAWDC